MYFFETKFWNWFAFYSFGLKVGWLEVFFNWKILFRLGSCYQLKIMLLRGGVWGLLYWVFFQCQLEFVGNSVDENCEKSWFWIEKKWLEIGFSYEIVYIHFFMQVDEMVLGIHGNCFLKDGIIPMNSTFSETYWWARIWFQICFCIKKWLVIRFMNVYNMAV